MALHAVTRALSDKPKCIGFLETLKKLIYLKIVLITPGII